MRFGDLTPTKKSHHFPVGGGSLWYSLRLIGRQRDSPLEHRIAPRRVVSEGHFDRFVRAGQCVKAELEDCAGVRSH
jgi:hypothetical protein